MLRQIYLVLLDTRGSLRSQKPGCRAGFKTQPGPLATGWLTGARAASGWSVHQRHEELDGCGEGLAGAIGHHAANGIANLVDLAIAIPGDVDAAVFVLA